MARNQLTLRVRRGEWPADVARPANFVADTGVEDPRDDAPPPVELVVAVDGEAVLYRWGGMGLEPDDVLNPDHPWVPPIDGAPVRKVIQRCGCGIIGCGSMTALIRRRGDLVEWSDIRGDGNPFDLGPFTFDADAYIAELHRAHEDRPWERFDETVARLVAESFRHLRGPRPRSFEWASADGEGHVLVSMMDRWANPLAGQPDGPRHDDGEGGWWQGVHPDELFEQYVGEFAIPPHLSAAEAAAAISAEVARDPVTWPAPRRRW